MVAQVFHFYAGAVDKHYGQTIPVAGGVDMTFREPLGVVGLIVPWKFPLNISSWKLGPALACGNTVVLKPAELTPLSALRLADSIWRPGYRRASSTSSSARAASSGSDWSSIPTSRRSASPAPPRSAAASCRARPGRSSVSRSSWAASRPTSSSRRRPRTGCSSRSLCGLRQRRTGLLRSLTHTVERSVYDRLAELLDEATRTVKVGDPAKRGDRDGPTDLGAAPREVASYVDGRAALPGRGPERRRASGVPARSSRRRTTTASPARRSSARSRRDPFDGRGRSRHHRQRHAVRTVRARSGRENGARACVSPVRSRRASSQSTRTASVRPSTPFGGFKQSGFGRELGMHALDGYSEIKNVYLATG